MSKILNYPVYYPYEMFNIHRGIRSTFKCLFFEEGHQKTCWLSGSHCHLTASESQSVFMFYWMLFRGVLVFVLSPRSHSTALPSHRVFMFLPGAADSSEFDQDVVLLPLPARLCFRCCLSVFYLEGLAKKTNKLLSQGGAGVQRRPTVVRMLLMEFRNFVQFEL